MNAYDLDGVLMPDVRFDLTLIVEINNFRTDRILPLFHPVGDWCIITARPMEDKQYVDAWVQTNFIDNPPKFIIQECPDSLRFPEGYKLLHIERHPEITKFIESDYKQAEFMKKHVRPGCEIIHFAELVRNAIEKQIQN